MVDPLFRARHGNLRGVYQLRLEPVPPLSAIHAEFLDVSNQPLEFRSYDGQLHRGPGKFVVGCEDHGVLAPLRDENQTLGVGGEPDLLGTGEIEHRLARLRPLQGSVPRIVIDNLNWFLRSLKQPREPWHDRVRDHHARIPEMGQMPLVAVFQTDTGQIRPDAARRKQMRHVKGILAGLADRPPAARLAGHRPDELRVAVPAAFPCIDLAAKRLQFGVVGRLRFHPFQFTQVRADHPGDFGIAGLRLQHR